VINRHRGWNPSLSIFVWHDANLDFYSENSIRVHSIRWCSNRHGNQRYFQTGVRFWEVLLGVAVAKASEKSLDEIREWRGRSESKFSPIKNTLLFDRRTNTRGNLYGLYLYSLFTLHNFAIAKITFGNQHLYSLGMRECVGGATLGRSLSLTSQR